MPRPRRLSSVVLLTATAVASWLGMMVVHELGHVLAAWLSGGRVTNVVLHPLAFSRTDLAENPHPSFVTWAGLVWGMALPVLVWLLARAARWKLAYLLRAFAGFCLIANGAYLGSAIVEPVGDAQDLVRLDTPLWMMVPIGLAGVVGGLAMWNGLGPKFGIGREATVDRAAVFTAFASLVVLIVGMLAWSALT
jgi:hypothetical protein